MLIRKDDIVQVIAGADRGSADDPTRAKVLQVDRQAGKAIVEGVGLVYKHVRRSQKNPQGGRLSKEMPIQLSNLMFFCDSCGKPSRLGARYLEDGSKERFCKKCGTGQGQIAPAKKQYAKK